MESMISRVFTRCYLIVQLNVLFLFLTVVGGVIFGVAPAYYTIISLFHEGGWDFLEQRKLFSRGWAHYKAAFGKTNLLAGIFLFGILLLSGNLWIAIQQKGLLFFILTLFLMFILFLLILLGRYVIQVEALYTLTIKENLLFSFAVLFADFKELLVQIVGLGLLFLLVLKFPAILLFGLFALESMWLAQTMKKRIHLVEEAIQ